MQVKKLLCFISAIYVKIGEVSTLVFFNKTASKTLILNPLNRTVFHIDVAGI